jgi:uncharacterized protein (TIGR00730 family)
MDDLKSEIQFLSGPQSRWTDLKFGFKILREFIRGFRHLHFVGPCVTFFGSARFEENHPYYKEARELARRIAGLGFTVLTGGGPGLMEAANRGAQEVGGRSVGCNIVSEIRQEPNPYLDKWVMIKYFFVRKTLLIKYSFAFIVLPGGFGTMDEFFEAVTLTQTRKIMFFPIIIFDREFYRDLIDHLEWMKLKNTISDDDLKLILVTDSMDEAIEFIKQHSIIQYGQMPESQIKPRRWLLERHWSKRNSN